MTTTSPTTDNNTIAPATAAHTGSEGATTTSPTLELAPLPGLSVSSNHQEISVNRPRCIDYLELAKPRLSSLVLLTTSAGYYMGSVGRLDFILLLNTLVGTALVAAGASSLNQLLERDVDARMNRTKTRPLPSGRITPSEVLQFGLLLAVSGILYLALMVNWLTSLLALITISSYLFLYTPLKRTTTLNTIVGAVPGALPPMMGWAGARGSLGYESWVLFAILFLWQIPHFLSIAWLYREDYERGGLCMLPVVDKSGEKTARQITVNCHALLIVSLIPGMLRIAGPIYLWGAFLLGIAFLCSSLRVAVFRTSQAARWNFLCSIVYLMVLFILMAANKV